MLTVSLETLPAGTLPAMAAEFDVSDSAIGRLVSIWGVTVILTSIPLVQRLSMRDRRTLTAACLAITGLFSIGTALAPTYGLALATRIGGGASHGVFWAIVVVYAATLAPARFLAAGIALVTGGSQLAAAIVIPLAASIVDGVGWRPIYAVLSVVAILIAAAVFFFLPADPPLPPPTRDRGARTWRDPRLAGPLALAVVALFFVFAHFAVYTYATVLFVTPTGASDPRLGLYLAIVGVASIIGLVISGPLANRWPRYGLVAYLLTFALGMALILPQTLGVRVSGLALWGLMFGVIGPVSQALAMRFAPAEFRPLISAAMVVTFNLGISGGAFAGGIATDTAGAHVTPYLAIGALIIGAGLALWAGPRLQDAPRTIPEK